MGIHGAELVMVRCEGVREGARLGECGSYLVRRRLFLFQGGFVFFLPGGGVGG